MLFEPYTHTVDNETYIETLKNVLVEIDQIMKAETTVYTINNKTFITERLATSLRHIIQEGTPLARLIKNQILESAYKAEKSGPNSTRFFLKFTMELVRSLIKRLQDGENTHQLNNFLDEEYNEFKKRLEKDIIPANWENIVECVNDASKSRKISDMVLEAVQLAGLEGNIVPSGSPNGKYSVELVTGYNFPVTTYPLFTEEDNGRWGRVDVRVLVVDGVIEKASECHKIFSAAYENKQPHLFVARGYGEEVIATIAANKHLDICPIRIPWELESINFIADISIVCGSKIVSAMKGDMVSNIDYEEIPIVDKIICTRENLNIINSRTQQAVAMHIADLSQRRDDTHVEQMSEFINKRIKSLNSHTVHIRIGAKTEQQKMKELESADFALRIIKGILNKGTVHFQELGFNEKLPTVSVLSAVFQGISLAKLLTSIECAIMND